MKKLSLLFLSTIMALCLFTSCSDDDDDNNKNSIVGKWQLSDALLNIVSDNEDFEEHVKPSFSIEGYDYETMEFTADGKILYDGEYYGDTYKLENGKLLIYPGDVGRDALIVTQDYTIKANTLTLSRDVKSILLEEYSEEYENLEITSATAIALYARKK